MWDSITDFIEINKTIDYDPVQIAVVYYLFFLWTVVSIWVFNDARKRYRSEATAFVWFLLVMIMTIPLLILYLTIRPDTDEDFADFGAEGLIIPVTELSENQELVITLRGKSTSQNQQRLETQKPVSKVISGFAQASHIAATQPNPQNAPPSQRSSLSPMEEPTQPQVPTRRPQTHEARTVGDMVNNQLQTAQEL